MGRKGWRWLKQESRRGGLGRVRRRGAARLEGCCCLFQSAQIAQRAALEAEVSRNLPMGRSTRSQVQPSGPLVQPHRLLALPFLKEGIGEE